MSWQLDLNGSFKIVKRVRSKNRECYGLTRVFKNRFKIYITEKVAHGIYDFAETSLHEILHLWFFIVGGRINGNVSERKQHIVIEKVIPVIFREVYKLRRGKRKWLK